MKEPINQPRIERQIIKLNTIVGHLRSDPSFISLCPRKKLSRPLFMQFNYLHISINGPHFYWEIGFGVLENGFMDRKKKGSWLELLFFFTMNEWFKLALRELSRWKRFFLNVISDNDADWFALYFLSNNIWKIIWMSSKNYSLDSGLL